MVSLPQIHVIGDFFVQESQTIRVSTNSARTASELSALLKNYAHSYLIAFLIHYICLNLLCGNLNL